MMEGKAGSEDGEEEDKMWMGKEEKLEAGKRVKGGKEEADH